MPLNLRLTNLQKKWELQLIASGERKPKTTTVTRGRKVITKKKLGGKEKGKRAMETRVAGVPEDEESGLLPRPSTAGRRPSSRGPRFPPPPAAWATVDGPLGLPLEDAEGHARRFFLWGFACLPFLWAINCCYFWPVLRSSAASSPSAFAPIRPCETTTPSSSPLFLLAREI